MSEEKLEKLYRETEQLLHECNMHIIDIEAIEIKLEEKRLEIEKLKETL